MSRLIIIIALLAATRSINGQTLLDPTFGTDGITIFGGEDDIDEFFELLQRPDGRLVALGHSGFDEDATLVCQFDANGALDPTFADNGVMQHQFTPGYDGFWCGALTSDGSILAGGYISSSTGIVCRITEQGGIDTDFGVDGITTLTGGQVIALHPLPDERLLAAVNSSRVHRVLADGTIDPAFNTTAIPDAGILMRINDITTLSDGTILCSGLSGGNSMVVWLHDDGSLATELGDAGVYMPVDTGVVHSVLRLENDRVLLVGRKGASFTSDIALTQLLPDGSLDPSFGNGGIARIDPDPANMHAAFRAAPSVDGGYWINGVASEGTYNALSHPFVFKCDGTGNADPGFGENGFALEPTVPCGWIAFHNNSVGHHIGSLLQGDGRLVMATCYQTAGMSKPDAGLYGLLVPSIAGIEASSPGTSLSIHPNPASDLITLSIPTSGDVLVHDAHGRCLILEPALRAGDHRIDIRALANGVYTVTWRSPDRSLSSRIVRRQ